MKHSCSSQFSFLSGFNHSLKSQRLLAIKPVLQCRPLPCGLSVIGPVYFQHFFFISILIIHLFNSSLLFVSIVWLFTWFYFTNCIFILLCIWLEHTLVSLVTFKQDRSMSISLCGARLVLSVQHWILNRIVTSCHTSVCWLGLNGSWPLLTDTEPIQ